MLTREEQLKSRANFTDEDGKLYLVRCLNCADSGDRGRENWAPNVASGVCAWCGWREEPNAIVKQQTN